MTPKSPTAPRGPHCVQRLVRIYARRYPHLYLSANIKIGGKWLYLDVDPWIRYQRYGPLEIRHWTCNGHWWRLTWHKTNVCWGYAAFSL